MSAAPDRVRAWEEDHSTGSALPRLAAEALTSGDAALAFSYANRKCNHATLLPSAEDFVLRAEAGLRLGDRSGALEDLQHAVEIDPFSHFANVRLLALADDDGKAQAARALLGPNARDDHLRAAIGYLHGQGLPFPRSQFDLAARKLCGWVLSDRDDAFQLTVDADGALCTVAVRGIGPVGGGVPYFLARIDGTLPFLPEKVTVRPGAEIGGGLAEFPSPSARAGLPYFDGPFCEADSVDDAPGRCTVIVPVHSDVEATNVCLESVAREMRAAAWLDLLIVDDASPDPAMKLLLASYGDRVLSNPHNMGFARSINRALERIGSGDVILLNSDTYVPQGFAGRLRAAAYRSASIGTVTPLSNNGEYTSFPAKFASSAMPDAAIVDQIDAAAQRVNAGRDVDLPSGVGFCIYIKRRCLDVVGQIPELFDKGYFEDVGFCLHAKAQGFRNVCATSVFVGHHGSRSFVRRRRALIVRNKATLLSYFPGYELESAAFVDADPLRDARAALERALLAWGERTVVIAPFAMQETMRTLAKGLCARPDGPSDVVIVWTLRNAIFGYEFVGLAEGWQGNLRAHQIEGELDALFSPRTCREIVITDPWGMPSAIWAGCQRSGARLRLALSSGVHALQDPEYRKSAGYADWRDVVAGCQKNGAELGFLGARFLSSISGDSVHSQPLATFAPIQTARATRAEHVAILIHGYARNAANIVKQAAQHVRAARQDMRVFVVIAAREQTYLELGPHVCVVGFVPVDAFGRVMNLLRIGRLAVLADWPLFSSAQGDVALQNGLAMAQIDWSLTEVQHNGRHLLLAGSQSPEASSDSLAAWLLQTDVTGRPPAAPAAG